MTRPLHVASPLSLTLRLDRLGRAYAVCVDLDSSRAEAILAAYQRLYARRLDILGGVGDAADNPRAPKHAQCGNRMRPSTPSDAGVEGDDEIFPWCCDRCGALVAV